MKANAVKRFYLVMNFPIYKDPTVLRVVKQYPLYRQIYENTKNSQLSESELKQLGLNPIMQKTTVRMMEVEIPIDQLY